MSSWRGGFALLSRTGRRTFGEFLAAGSCTTTNWRARRDFDMLTFFVIRRFEAYDEPWKESFDTDTQKWESKWGLFDEDRKLKDGLKIPDCGGVTVDKAY